MAVVVSTGLFGHPLPDPPREPRQRGDAAGRRPASSLDQQAVNGSTDIGEDVLILMPCSCRAWCCPHCVHKYWGPVKARVFPHLHIFRKPALLTLTIDRKQFDSGKHAYEHVQGEGLIRRLLRLVGLRKGFMVLAFHPKAPEWPHWHILIDRRDAGARIDFEQLWRLWRGQWGCGGLDVSFRDDFQSAVNAASYIVQYCQHQASANTQWIRELTRLPRVYETYGELRKAIHAARTETPRRSEAEDSEQGAKRQRTERTVADRLADCGTGSTALVRRQFGGDHVSYGFAGTLSSPPTGIAMAARAGLLVGFDIRDEMVQVTDNYRRREVRVLLDGAKPKDVIERLERALATAHQQHAGASDNGDWASDLLPDEETE